ncbi:MAG: N-acetylmuramoyl-L-alanine amidase [Kangiellaceae bacterium]
MLVLLDNGHGGLINGDYQTPGKRSPIWDDGSQLFEGEFNRAIVARIIESLTSLNIAYINIAPEMRDVTLATRIKRANDAYKRKCFYLSVHSNAGGGRGFEVFTSRGHSKSDKIATLFGEEFKKTFPDKKLRADYSDGDLDKEAGFAVLKRTRMPAILTENFFMDNEEECKNILMTRHGRDAIADFHVNAIVRAQKEIFLG